MSRLILNAVQLSTSSNAKVQICTVPYNEGVLADLRRQHIGTHIFHRDHDSDQIQCIPTRSDAAEVGEPAKMQALEEAPWLINALTIEALTGFFHNLGRSILRRRPLRLLSEKPDNLLPQGFGLPSWLQKRLTLE